MGTFPFSGELSHFHGNFPIFRGTFPFSGELSHFHGNFPDFMRTFLFPWELSHFHGNFPIFMGTFQFAWELSHFQGNFPIFMGTFPFSPAIDSWQWWRHGSVTSFKAKKWTFYRQNFKFSLNEYLPISSFDFFLFFFYSLYWSEDREGRTMLAWLLKPQCIQHYPITLWLRR